MNENKPIMPEKPKESWLAGIIMIVVVFAILKACNPNYATDSTDEKSDDYYYACTAAQKEVKEKLKSPSSAKFGLCSDMDITNSGDVWTIKGEVEASNSFGAMIINNFIVKIERTGENTYNRISVSVY